MSDDKEKRLICAPADWPLAARGASFARRCSECGGRVMVGPAGLRALADDKDLAILCVLCLRRHVKQGARPEIREAPGAREEMKTVEPNRWLERN